MPNEDASSGPGTGTSNRFGTFGGVFTPDILTILGLILFMRANFIVGQSGILGAIGILLIAKAITSLTALSICAISTNTQVRGGGAYYLISRVLGPEFGGAIGIALFFSAALSVPFYFLGFTEAVVRTYPALAPHFQLIAFATAAVFFGITYVGATWAIRMQYLIMVVLAVSLVTLLGGAINLFSSETLAANWSAPGPDDLPGGAIGFWVAFAIYFPAVTGILTGVNMSGDLKEPSKAIPRGTLLAVAVGGLVYLVQIVVCGGAFSRADLVAKPFDILKDNALFGLGTAVVAGAFTATLSSALGSFLGAPRVLQAVARDGILKSLKPFAAGSAKGDEPRRAIVLTGFITAGVLLWAGNDAGGDALNAVAVIISMFFVYTYGVINLAAFLEAFTGNPSFRPRFRFFHWGTALVGTVSCLGVAFLIHWVAATVAALAIGGLVLFVKTREMESTFGDARRGFLYIRVRDNLLRLAAIKEDPKNWRPTVLVFSGNPAFREIMVTYSVWLESGRGIVFLASIIQGKLEEGGPKRAEAIRQLDSFCQLNDIQALPAVVVAETVERGITMLLQTGSIGPIRPNMAVFGWSGQQDRVATSSAHLRSAIALGMSLVLIKPKGWPSPLRPKRVDIWWRGEKNGGLMMILAHLLTHNWEWSRRTELRVLRLVASEEERTQAEEELQGKLHDARVAATARAVLSDAPYADVLHQESSDASCVFLGFEVPAPGEEEEWWSRYELLLDGLPTTLMVCSVGLEDMRA